MNAKKLAAVLLTGTLAMGLLQGVDLIQRTIKAVQSRQHKTLKKQPMIHQKRQHQRMAKHW